MREIRLFCAAGMSTSALVNKMRKAAAEQGLEYEVNAFSVSQIEEEGPKADIVFLGPQVGYRLKSVQETLPDKHVEVIDFTTYGMMDGAKLIKKCKEFFGD
ncbi:MAG: PTS sugar transporter subunit IIB [Erysipelotrichaceae bacterium]|nr:PTS sugar transporter subunit IIB [Erysipelotrichaceae bacterium]